MARTTAARRRIGSVVLALACLGVAGGIGWSVFGKQADSQASAVPADGKEMTGSLDAGPKTLGPSGFPIPRFVSLKTDKINVRKGPSSEHPVAWVFQRKGMPVEIVAEFENWRRIRDSDGAEGWILQNMLTGKRTAVVAPWRPGKTIALRREANRDSPPVAELASGVLADIASCTGKWCEIGTGGYDGYVEQAKLWGVYPGEAVN
ncbi:MAG: SH3 domain-containing protein [Rhizobiales bacterium]|nr:SH3 domain-containing protein [Hyphomicrobiales bacterium]MBI3673247.1 SH3 domain-containing protein [Hyphomicrobiales bacterium]